MEFKKGDTVICKKYYFYNGHFFPGDKFKIIEINENHVKLQTRLNNYNIIYYDEKHYNKYDVNYLYFWNLFYSKEELRRIKIKNIKQNINI